MPPLLIFFIALAVVALVVLGLSYLFGIELGPIAIWLLGVFGVSAFASLVMILNMAT